MTEAQKLHMAVQGGQVEDVEDLLKQGVAVNAHDAGGWTALNWACLEGHLQIAQLLVESGAELNTAGEQGFSPLHQAVGENHQLLVKYLIEKGADVNSRCWSDCNGTALHAACVCFPSLSYIIDT